MGKTLPQIFTHIFEKEENAMNIFKYIVINFWEYFEYINARDIQIRFNCSR